MIHNKFDDFEFINCHSYQEKTGNALGIRPFKELCENEIRYHAIYLNIDNKSGHSNFSTIEEVLNFKENNDLVYRYVEYDRDKIKTIIRKEEKIFLTANYYQLGNDWTVYLNSKNNIKARQEFEEQIKGKSVGETFYINNNTLKSEPEYYLWLSSAYFILKNTELVIPEMIKNEIERFYLSLEMKK